LSEQTVGIVVRMAKVKGPRQEPEPIQAPEIVEKPSAEAVLLFLRHAALEDEWMPNYLADALGIDIATAKQIASELELVGYAEPVPEKHSLRNTPTGNAIAGAKLPARLTRETAEQILTDVADRAEAFNLDGARPVRVRTLTWEFRSNQRLDRT
jgi:hypothetical protein